MYVILEFRVIQEGKVDFKNFKEKRYDSWHETLKEKKWLKRVEQLPNVQLSP